MLAALLCHVQTPGGVGRIDEGKAQVALEALRKEYLERQEAEKAKALEAIKQGDMVASVSEEVFQIPVLPEAGATSCESTVDDELALVLILAHC